jgi:hypothetical protein
VLLCRASTVMPVSFGFVEKATYELVSYYRDGRKL